MSAPGAGQFALALASFMRAQASLPLQAIAGNQQCLDLAGQLLGLLQAPQKPDMAPRRGGGRPPRHDAEWAQSALLDAVVRDPDGVPCRQAVLVEWLASAFTAAGRPVPGAWWLKSQARLFQEYSMAFEAEALAKFRASPDLRTIFASEAEFLRFRRQKKLLEEESGRKISQDTEDTQGDELPVSIAS